MNRRQSVDASALDPASRAEFERRLAAAMAEAAPPSPAGAADARAYTIAVEDAGTPAEPVRLRRTDATMTPAFADLLSWVEQQPRAATLTDRMKTKGES